MARILTASCKQCRREGAKLFLKGEKCVGAKCTLIKRNYIPGQHGLSRRRGKPSDYLLQLREKQKVKRIYGILETQFRNYFEKADRKQGVTGEILLPFIFQAFTGSASLVVGGTGVLIVVGVAIEVKNQLDAQLITRSYEEF